ncbi:hypothetical protein WN51_10812 [Melipona quadrifasciata]|uniref:Uncharacterized protein n=1 Tax=Melipona quadrifasciata TaxID=166423 RepID=A0A0M9A5M7_9HYME|nr:hypothetical protein WN51_10812 [Melipona quadrifasciata]
MVIHANSYSVCKPLINLWNNKKHETIHDTTFLEIRTIFAKYKFVSYYRLLIQTRKSTSITGDSNVRFRLQQSPSIVNIMEYLENITHADATAVINQMVSQSLCRGTYFASSTSNLFTKHRTKFTLMLFTTTVTNHGPGSRGPRVDASNWPPDAPSGKKQSALCGKRTQGSRSNESFGRELNEQKTA